MHTSTFVFKYLWDTLTQQGECKHLALPGFDHRCSKVFEQRQIIVRCVPFEINFAKKCMGRSCSVSIDMLCESVAVGFMEFTGETHMHHSAKLLCCFVLGKETR